MELLDQADYSEGELERPLSVLVVDDEPSILISLKRLLAVCGYQVTVAAGGGQALAQLASNRYDLLLLDLAAAGNRGSSGLGRCDRSPPGYGGHRYQQNFTRR